jgi:hypothetical protein
MSKHPIIEELQRQQDEIIPSYSTGDDYVNGTTDTTEGHYIDNVVMPAVHESFIRDWDNFHSHAE